MVGWHHRLDGHEFEQAPGVGDGQGNLACCGPWGHKQLDTTEQLNNLYSVFKAPPVSADFFIIFLCLIWQLKVLIATPGVYNLHCGMWTFFFFLVACRLFS